MSAIMDKTEADIFAWVDWIIAEREKREWSQADLARKAGIKRQTINGYESHRRTKPDEQVLVKISEAFGYHPEFLPRMAGLLPSEPNRDEWAEKTAHKLRKLSPPLRSVADRMIDGLLQEQETNEKPKTKIKSARA